MLDWAVNECDGPVAIRYPRGGDRNYIESRFADGAVACHRTGEQLTIITYGTMLDNCMKAADILSQQGVETTVLRLLRVDPLPETAILENVSGSVLIVEEACSGSGIHEAIMEYENNVFFEILAEDLARRDMNDVPIDESNYDEFAQRIDSYIDEFEAHGTDHITIECAE